MPKPDGAHSHALQHLGSVLTMGIPTDDTWLQTLLGITAALSTAAFGFAFKRIEGVEAV